MRAIRLWTPILSVLMVLATSWPAAGQSLLGGALSLNDALDQAVMKHLQVVGPPTILIIGPDGREYRAQGTTGEVSANVFLDRLAQARES